MNEQILNVGSKKSLHYGINYIFLPSIQIDKKAAITFQSKLLENQVEFSLCRVENESIALTNAPEKSSIQVKVYRPNPSLSGFTILHPLPEILLTNFTKTCEAISAAFSDTWFTPELGMGSGVQFIQKDVTIRCLYQTAENHSFAFLWEKKLGQKPESLNCLKRPVMGGGLSLVMPPHMLKGIDREPVAIKIKIESYNPDPRMLFIEINFTWPKPSGSISKDFLVEPLLKQVEDYNNNELIQFLKDL